jgi:tRNA 2-thiocytidine biosynthesis protein TtcA
MNAHAATAAERPSVEMARLEKRLYRQIGHAISTYNMIEPGDKVMVCVSGGKDSHALLDLLLGLQRRAPTRFELVAVNLDQKQPGFPEHVLPAYLQGRGVAFHIAEQDTHSVVKRLVPEGRCAFAGRRRGALTGRERARRDQDRARPPPRRHVQTLFMNMPFGGRPRGMPPPRQRRRSPRRIRPLAFVAETDLERWPLSATFRSSRARRAAARTTCSASASARCCATGNASTRVASTTCSTRWPMSCRRT